ncbi:MAG: methyltransferase type 12, partial [Bacteroidetes bacterium]|nr:methyltransferase type 12 [Bacteroidota bacterium]
MNNTKSAEAGQAVYSKTLLSIYDLWVLGFSNSFLWRCPTTLLRREFIKNVTSNHLDIGVGTGYYLDKCLDDAERRLALLDLNPNSLEATASRI